jgi:hypothetical protein
MRRLAVVLALLAALGGCSLTTPQQAPPPSAAPTVIVMPDVVGQNAAVALDKLHKLGLKNIDLGTVDGHEFVVLPQNWTVKTQSAHPGEKLAPDAKVVLGCARNN